MNKVDVSMSEWFELVENNSEFLVVYKKPNTNFHTENNELGLFERVKQALALDELYPAHRLDKVTSGLLVMAKTKEANQELDLQFKLRKIEKYYLAISAKKPKKKQGLIKGDMASARRGAWKLMPTENNPAITQFFSLGLGEGKRLFIVKPYTGKTHQIRVALKSIGSPILGDELYADTQSCIGTDRVYLHAYSLSFSMNEKQYRFTELPREGREFIAALSAEGVKPLLEPWTLAWPKIS